jgi:hypothetical protein
MADIRVFHDREGQTLTVWFGDPSQEYICEETGEGIILMKDKKGRVLGLEKLYFSVSDAEALRAALETAAA